MPLAEAEPWTPGSVRLASAFHLPFSLFRLALASALAETLNIPAPVADSPRLTLSLIILPLSFNSREKVSLAAAMDATFPSASRYTVSRGFFFPVSSRLPPRDMVITSPFRV